MANSVAYRTAMEVSKDENFDEIYEKRFRKYCMLLSKEKEYLKRLEGHRIRSFSFQQESDTSLVSKNYRTGIDRNTDINKNNNQDFDSISTARRFFSDGRRTTSLKDMRRVVAPKIIFSREGRKLSTSYEAVDELGSSPPTETLRSFSISSQDRFPYRHSQSNDETLRHSQSSEETLSNDGSYTSARMQYSVSCENLLSDPFYRTSSTGNRMYTKCSPLTSSTQSLSEKNVRSINRNEITKYLTNAELKKRVIEAKVKHRKRGEKLKELDDDFNKAREIMQKYKSNDSLNNISNNHTNTTFSSIPVEDKRHSWIV